MRIGHLMLGARDLEVSLEFYRDKVGLEVQFAGPELAFLSAGAVTVALRRAADLPPPNDERRAEIVFAVDDVKAAYQAMKGRGVPFRCEPRPVTPDGQQAADFRDPDGNVLSIFGR